MENQLVPPPGENKSKFLPYVPYAIIPLFGGVIIFLAINFFVTKQKAQTPPAVATTPPVVEQQARDVSVNWLPEPAKMPPSTLGLSVKDPNAWEGITVNDIYTVYQVGTVTSAPFQNDALYVIARACLGPCGISHYRVIDDRGKQGLVFLTNLSNEIDPSDKVFFVATDYYNIPSLKFPATLSVQHASATLRFEAEDFSPAAMFKDYIAGGNWDHDAQKYIARNLRSDIQHPEYGTLYEETDDGSFIVRLPDGTVKLYRLQFPFSLSGDDKTGFLVQSTNMNLRFADGGTFTAQYTPISPRVCPPRAYDIQKGIAGRIKKGGAIDSVGDFYELSNPNDPMYNEIDQSFSTSDESSRTSFLADRPILFWKDILGRWFRLRNMKFNPALETECGYFNSVL